MLLNSRQTYTHYLQNLQENIIAQFQSLENRRLFSCKQWDYQAGSGGGKMCLLKGNVFEKAAVNFSAIEGKHLPFKESSGPFFATGVSLITHMMNPFAPTVHMNVRYIETESKFWFGGGYDLTPMGFYDEEDKQHFHKTARNALEPFGKDLYEEFSKNAAEYFYIPHRKKERGVGGIFFDYLNSGDLDRDYGIWKAVGDSFIESIMPIYMKKHTLPYTELDKELQNQNRAHYVEFNLIYDRGTKFGLQSNGNPESILSSLPPTATWS